MVRTNNGLSRFGESLAVQYPATGFFRVEGGTERWRMIDLDEPYTECIDTMTTFNADLYTNLQLI